MGYQRLIIANAVGLIMAVTGQDAQAGRFFRGHGGSCGNCFSMNCGNTECLQACGGPCESGEKKEASIASAEAAIQPHGDVFTLGDDIYYLETGDVGRKTVYKLDKAEKDKNGHYKWHQYSEPLVPAGDQVRTPQG